MSDGGRCPRCAQPMDAEGLAVARGVTMKLRAEANAAAIGGLRARVKELEADLHEARAVLREASRILRGEDDTTGGEA